MRMVRTGLVRAFGADLRNLIGKTTSNRFTAYQWCWHYRHPAKRDRNRVDDDILCQSRSHSR